MKLLFVADPLESFKIYKDTTFAMMRAAQARGHQVSACEPRDLRWVTGGVVDALTQAITLTGESPRWYEISSRMRRGLKD